MRIILLVMSIIAAAYAVAADSHALKQRLNDAINGLNATVGIAVITGNGDTVTINNEQHYPLMSVMKLHQAIYLAHFLHHNGWNIDHCIKVEKNDLKPDTYSPLRDSIPEGTASITIGELLRYSLQLSDNNACDILFNLSGGPAATNSYIRNYGKIHDFAITATEDNMHRDTALCRANRPVARRRICRHPATAIREKHSCWLPHWHRTHSQGNRLRGSHHHAQDRHKRLRHQRQMDSNQRCRTCENARWAQLRTCSVHQEFIRKLCRERTHHRPHIVNSI